MIVINWKEAPRLPPRYRGLLNRPWPSGWYGHTRKLAVQIDCAEGYDRDKAESGEHAPLTLRLLDHSTRPPEYCYEQPGFLSLELLKNTAVELLERHPRLVPPTRSKPIYGSSPFVAMDQPRF